jgi:hypothetical protein
MSTTIKSLTDAMDLLVWSEIRLYTPLGGTYVALVNDLSVEDDKVTIFVQHVDGGELGIKSLVCEPTTGIEVVKKPDLTPYGKVEALIKRWDNRMVEVGNDDQYVGAGELLDDLKIVLEGMK